MAGLDVNEWLPEPNLISPTVASSVNEGDILLLPDRIRDGAPFYRDDNAGIVKTARANGLPLRLAWPSSEFSYISEYGAPDVIADVLIGVVGNLSTDTLKYIYHFVQIKISARTGIPLGSIRDEHGTARLKIAKYEKREGLILIEGLEYSGSKSEVSKMLASLAGVSPQELNTTGQDDDDSR